jgi:hypothetical protein
MAQVVEQLLSKSETLSSNPTTTTKKKKKGHQLRYCGTGVPKWLSHSDHRDGCIPIRQSMRGRLTLSCLSRSPRFYF